MSRIESPKISIEISLNAEIPMSTRDASRGTTGSSTSSAVRKQNGMIRAFVLVFCLAGTDATVIAQESRPPKEQFPEAIEDNSFFIEEAYNQERGVVQHISSLQYSFTHQKDLLYTFTQEWPLGSRAHQLSYTAPINLYSSSHPGGFGDILINYRYQLVDDDGWAAVAPRFSVLLPTGSAASGLGTGVTGVQINIPASKRFSESFVAHANAGLTVVPHMKDDSGPSGTIKHTLTSYNIGASIIWLTSGTFNVMLEYTTSFSSDAFEDGSRDRSTDTIISPGLRWAINLNTLQIVPGVAVPILLGSGQAKTGVFFYLSFEHPF
jgi:hypothetical protein